MFVCDILMQYKQFYVAEVYEQMYGFKCLVTYNTPLNIVPNT